jgi:hypothetical protein
MILGIGLFGLLPASLASLLVERDLERDRPADLRDEREVGANRRTSPRETTGE